ncbi:phosphatase PAP2 family protein [Modestobacter excelsi]|uniref:phosphatase PAP2 family protein n=1 Tax=Modestobacter excelsi TaxID=2213161 RepID=UPI001C20CA02|nr:phosphatase PAP2 family protein [Modestobacter excelsi]
MSDPDTRRRTQPGVLAGARSSTIGTLTGAVVGAFVLVEALLLGLGLLITRVLDGSPVDQEEVDFENAVAAHRTPTWNSITHYGTVLGATSTVVALTAAGCLVLALRRHGPRLPLFLALAVIGETLLFLLAAAVLDRLRPPIPHLDAAPPTSSFPSGHTAASVALWVGLALGLSRTRPGHRLRFLSWSLAVAVPLFVLLSRLYRGMHWPTDVAAGVVFSLAWLLLLRAVLLPAGDGEENGSARR